MSYPKDILSRMYSRDSHTELLYPKEEDSSIEEQRQYEEVAQTNLFNVMLNRRSQRKFENKPIEDNKIELILAAADTAPTAGGFQGFEIFYIKDSEIKVKLAEAANNQPYVNAPLVLVFCMNPGRVKMNFSPDILKKFSLQDATLAASYSQLAAHALGLSSIWIGMIDEGKVMKALGTSLVPATILCFGYPHKMLQPKPKRSLIELIHTI
jgi:FMN reductase [NAD(P)H]